MRSVTVTLALMLTLGGCMSSGSSEGLREREWKLVSVEGFPVMPEGVANPTLRFAADGHLRGNTGCNSAGAAYTTDGDRLTLQPMMVTKRACVNPEGNRLEWAYVQALEKARRFRLAGDELELLDAQGNTVARFR